MTGAPPAGTPARSLRSADDLVRAGLVAPERAAEISRVIESYALAVTPEMAALIDRDDPADPIARQFIPDPAELRRAAEEHADPIGDEAHTPVRGIVHRYPDRVLLTPTLSCPVYCRFCFRRERVGPLGAFLRERELAAAYDYIRQRPEIFEVIVTGGDPFLMSARRIGEIVRALSSIEHIGVIRFHTRVPVVDPSRVTDQLVQALETEKGLFVAIHANHPREFSAAAVAALRRLGRAGVALLGRTVLLRGVNDEAAILADLFRAMVRSRIKPYYLHHADLAPGTADFRTTISEGQSIVAALRGHVSGLCQPCYVLDLPGGHGKVPIGPQPVSLAPAEGQWVVTDYRGKQHLYPPILT